MIANLEIYLSETEIWENIRLSYQMADNLNLNNNNNQAGQVYIQKTIFD